MKILIAVLLSLLPTLAFADAFDFCRTVPHEQQVACVQAILQGQREMMEQQAQTQQQLYRDQQAAQREMARQQALGWALFGSGAAAINGMNQGFNTMSHSTDWMKNPNLSPPIGATGAQPAR